MIEPDVCTVRWNLYDLQRINIFEFHCGSMRGSRHSANLRIQADEVLNGDRPENFPAGCGGQPFFGRKRCLQPVRQIPVLRHASGIFFD
ncbi:hypothetical protein D3C76_476960 [compost metagenome]